jgi:hypothetical protein
MKFYSYKSTLIRNFYRYLFISYLILRSLWRNCGLHYIWYYFILYCVGSYYIFVNFFFLIFFFFENLIKSVGVDKEFNELNYFIFDSASNLFFIILFFCFILLFLYFLWNILNVLHSIKQRIHYFSFILKRKFYFRCLFIFFGFISVIFIIKYILIPLYIWYFFYFKNDYYNSVISFYPEISFVLFFHEIKQIISSILIFFIFFFILFYETNNEKINKFINLFILYKNIFYAIFFMYLLFVCPPHLFYVLFLVMLFILFDFSVINYFWISKKKKVFFFM